MRFYPASVLYFSRLSKSLLKMMGGGGFVASLRRALISNRKNFFTSCRCWILTCCRTTTDLTTSFAQGVARVFHLGFAENVIEYIVRAVSCYAVNISICTYLGTSYQAARCVLINVEPTQVFFGLNLVFNGIMWTLFTQALAKGHSTTQVSIMNTSSNFVITAMLGLVIFSESLPPLWWAGAALLVAGNVIIGSKDESSKPAADEDHREGIVAPAPGLDGRGDYEDVPQIDGILDPELKDDEDEDILELGELRE